MDCSKPSWLTLKSSQRGSAASASCKRTVLSHGISSFKAYISSPFRIARFDKQIEPNIRPACLVTVLAAALLPVASKQAAADPSCKPASTHPAAPEKQTSSIVLFVFTGCFGGCSLCLLRRRKFAGSWEVGASCGREVGAASDPGGCFCAASVRSNANSP